jgi:hypothetical protein
LLSCCYPGGSSRRRRSWCGFNRAIADRASRCVAPPVGRCCRCATPTSGPDSLRNAAAAARRCGDGPQWFAHWPNANIGVVTGGISNLIVFDVDPKHGSDDSLAALELASARCLNSGIPSAAGRCWTTRKPPASSRASAGCMRPSLWPPNLCLNSEAGGRFG